MHPLDEAIDLPVGGISLTLRPEITNLRNAALKQQSQTPGMGIPTLPLIDSRSWSEHSDDEDWLIWRARRTAARLRNMPLALSPGERVVGRPELRPPTPEEAQEIERVQGIIQSIPPYPGGDSGHFHPDYQKLFGIGIRGIREEIQSRKRKAATSEQQTFYQACDMAMEGLSEYAQRVAEECERAAETATEKEAVQWRELARICRHVSTEPPTTFHEALELMFLTLIGLWFGEDHGLTTPGRMDQTLRPFYEADLSAGRISREDALELICCLYIQTNMILGPGSALSVMVGGRDQNGHDAACELTYLCLAARQATQLVYPTVGVAWHEGTPSELMDFCTRMIATGIGDPAFFNDEVIAEGLRAQGVTEEDCHNFMNSTCVEIKVVGRSNMWVTQPYINLPQGLLNVMARVAEGTAPQPESFEALAEQVRGDLAGTTQAAAERLDGVWHARADTGCFPLASCLIHDCLERGRDFDQGGARYNWVENSFVGLANLVDGLGAIKHFVYQRNALSLSQFHEVLQADFDGREDLRQQILNTVPKYGNNDDEADELARQWAEFLIASTESNRVGLHRYMPGFFCWVMHERLGSQTGATPDGRQAGWPLADGAGAAQGREKSGPTASVLSTTKWCHREVLGGLVHNAKFPQSLLETDDARAALRSIIETYLQRGGFEIQINVVGKEVLLDAQQHPDQYPDLLVRVAGYSDYFVHLNKNMQDEVIARTEHEI